VRGEEQAQRAIELIAALGIPVAGVHEHVSQEAGA
jgi:hypothetical protein